MRLGIIAGSRSDYGLLEPLLEWLQAHNCDGGHQTTLIQLFAASTASGWPSERYQGASLRVVECFADSDSPEGVCSSMGLVYMKLPQVLKEGAYDKVIVLGDRFEILSAACCAYTLGIPISHIEGGDMTLGSLDNGYRSAIRSLAAEHYDVEEYGSLGCVFPLFTVARRSRPCAVLIYHPCIGDWEGELRAIIDASRGYVVHAFRANKDAGGARINKILEENVNVLDNLSRAEYLSKLKSVDFIIGNSSSGLIEAPSLKVPTVNVGDRQKGRLRAASVIDCNSDTIKEAIEKTKTIAWETVVNPYEKPDTVERIGRRLLNFR